jgi:mannose-6-phosphate isomerase class I
LDELKERSIDALSKLEAYLRNGDLKMFFTGLLSLDANTKTTAIEQLKQSTGKGASNDQTIEHLVHCYPDDIGVFASVFLNAMTLLPGEGLFLEAGVLHSYLKGTALELMANSDNVLRAGLTSKNVDVKELMSVARFEPRSLSLLKAGDSKRGWSQYPAPTRAFELIAADVDHGAQIELLSTGPQLLLCLEGKVEVRSSSSVEQIDAQTPLFIAADTHCTLKGRGRCFVARTADRQFGF